ncbi:beta-galactosidase [Paenibacillus qinlingensis]|uniref:Beta-galactosidase n=1 Tax=Paenibacillus qinlingensis TaxID=1837343 RepID=A0ABU1P528_9BACL|nr:beta-galactosidase [Paenibacillus qinlingensis]MDR6554860.1 beta-galactosidase [Paenibacillus qinlingensis]
MTWRREKMGQILYGADYYPEQWPEEVWLEDMKLMKEAGVNIVRLGIFAWASIQPEEHRFEFGWLDRIMDLLAENGIAVHLATATASPPAWLTHRYPETMNVDVNGHPYRHGSRQHYSPASKVFRQYCAELVRKIAERYKNHPALFMWHINNEHGGHLQKDYTPDAITGFREWLQRRYGTLDELNDQWGTAFWSQKYSDWEEIGPPSTTPIAFCNPGQELDFSRYMNDCLLELYLNEYRILREVTPDVPILASFMMEFKWLNYYEWAKHMDVVGLDTYPDPRLGIPVSQAMDFDMLRSMKDSQPYLLMEQVTTQVNWRRNNAQKKPGQMRLWSYQSIARGGDGILFFQWRQSKAGAEKFHGALVPHSGDVNSRVYREVRQLGEELQRLEAVVGSRIKARTAILFDYENWWAVEMAGKPSADIRYREQVMKYYTALHELNVAVDIVQPHSDLSGYDLVLAPTLYMIDAATADRLERFVESGGTLLTTFWSGMVDRNDRIHLGGYPAPLRKLLGIHVEEFDPFTPEQTSSLQMVDPDCSGDYSCSLWADIIRLEGAKALGVFTADYYEGYPAVTENAYGKGSALYVGMFPEQKLADKLIRHLAERLDLLPDILVPSGVETSVREDNGKSFQFVLNHLEHPVVIDLKGRSCVDLITGSSFAERIELESYDVAILKWK